MIYDIIEKNGPMGSMLDVVSENYVWEKPEDGTNALVWTDAEELMVNMAETLVDKRAIGLAAIQVGIPYRVMVVGNPDDPDSIMCFFNPKVTHQEHELSIMTEGCLSFPDMYVKIRRPNLIRIRYQDVKGEWGSASFSGLTAHCVLHEIDHMDGITFDKRAVKYHWEKARKKIKKFRRLKEKSLAQRELSV